MATFPFELGALILLQVHSVVVVFSGGLVVLGLHVPHFSFELESHTLLVLTLFLTVELLFLDLLVVVAVLSG